MKEKIIEILQNHSRSFIMDIEINDLIADKIMAVIVERMPKEEEKTESASKNITSSWKGHSQGWYYHFIEGWEACMDEISSRMKGEIDWLNNVKK